MEINFRPIKKEEILTILPLLKQINLTTPDDLLKERVLEMTTYNTYECVGII